MTLTDITVTAKVIAALIRDPRVSVLDIGVRTEDGRVSLTGDVDSGPEKRAAAEIARKVEGVRGVKNKLTVGKQARGERLREHGDKLLTRLADEWDRVPPSDPEAGLDYFLTAIRWICRIRAPYPGASDYEQIVSELRQRAIRLVAGLTGMSPIQVALELKRLTMNGGSKGCEPSLQ